MSTSWRGKGTWEVMGRLGQDSGRVSSFVGLGGGSEEASKKWDRSMTHSQSFQECNPADT